MPDELKPPPAADPIPPKPKRRRAPDIVDFKRADGTAVQIRKKKPADEAIPTGLWVALGITGAAALAVAAALYFTSPKKPETPTP